ncbi:hypothetical protein GCM10027047_13110 [Rhodococcus aerolatus]
MTRTIPRDTPHHDGAHDDGAHDGRPAEGGDVLATPRDPAGAQPPPSGTRPGDDAPGTRPRWARPALGLLLLATAGFYLVNLSANGYANSFYSAAVQAGSRSWEAFLFGSSDAASSITVDKPPAALWVMELSVRVFGLNSWAVLVPEVLMGVASVALLHASVARRSGPAAGLLAGLVLALTPVAVLMFRFNNPDALLVLLMVAAVWALLRAVDDGRTRWLVLTGALVGLGFLTKQLQVLLVVPPLALTYLVAGPPRLGRRLLQLLAALGALLVAAGWWVALVELVPASMRPYVGGSQDNSFLSLTFGYNGFGRLTGSERGSVGGGGAGATAGGTGFWGATGISRLFGSEFAGQIAWLAPAALVLGVVGVVLRGRAPRTDPRRASYLVWGLWLVVTWLTFSFMAGIFHAYYTVALAPAVAALVGSGAVAAWRARDRAWVPVVLALTLLGSAVWAWALLGRSASFVPWLRTVVLVVGVVASLALLAARFLPRRVTAVVALAALATGLAGPTAYAVQTVGTAHSGSLVSAGPTVPGGMGGRGGPGGARGPRGAFGGGATGTGAGPGTAPGGARGGQLPTGGAAALPGIAGGTTATGVVPGVAGGAPGATTPGGPGGAGSLLDGSTPSAALTALLEQDADRYTWVAATVGSNSASGYQLATQDPVMPIGGFNGTDPSPTLAQFQADVAAGEIHWFIAGGGFGGGRGGTAGASSEITAWVEATYTAQTVDGVTLYDLTAPTTAG